MFAGSSDYSQEINNPNLTKCKFKIMTHHVRCSHGQISSVQVIWDEKEDLHLDPVCLKTLSM